MENNNSNNNTIGKLKAILKLKYQITILTGLHIGGSKENIEIGGIDNIVIKIPVIEFDSQNQNEKERFYNVPYIPGSSLKGKIRSLLEWTYSPYTDKDPKNQNPIAIEYNGEPCKCGKCNICKLFGSHNTKESQIPRLIFEDFYPTKDTIQMWEQVLEGSYVEIKTENVVNRITGKAEHPRHIERVIPYSIFEGYITFKIFENDNYELFETLEKGINLLNNDYLGGNGSRGYGKIKMELIEAENKYPNQQTITKDKITENKIKELFGENNKN